MQYRVRDAFPGESYDAEFWDVLVELNKHCLAAPPVEGNSFYWDGTLTDPYQTPDQKPLLRRRELSVRATGAKRILEVGVNGGHSALLMLATNPAAIYWGVDICAHDYTSPCMERLAATFGERCNFVRGDSARALPVLLASGIADFDFIHVDGAHDVGSALTDLMNAHRVMSDAGVILCDDMQLPGPRAAAELLIGDDWLRGEIGEHFAVLHL